TLGPAGGRMTETLPRLFRATGPAGVSTLRLHLMRLLFAGTFLFVGTNAWKRILTHEGPWDPLHGGAFSLWGLLGADAPRVAISAEVPAAAAAAALLQTGVAGCRRAPALVRESTEGLGGERNGNHLRGRGPRRSPRGAVAVCPEKLSVERRR